jgi:predicted nuclease of predicted toxin-antitoxin system
MKIKLDENLPVRLVDVLVRHGHETDTVIDENLAGHPDDAVWQASVAEQRFLITQDLDFSDTRKFTPGAHPGILLVRLREPGGQHLLKAVSAIAGEIDGWAGCFVVLTDHKIRVKRPA